jgi:hypothetical protein
VKTRDVRELIAQENYRAALCGAKDFRSGITKEQRSTMRRGYECMVHPEFYRQIGKDIDECIHAGIAVLQEVVNA